MATPLYGFVDPYGIDSYGDDPLPSQQQARQNRQDFARGVSYLPQDLLGAPVDLINLGLWGIDSALGTRLHQQKPVGGSDWLIEQSRKYAPQYVQEPTHSGWELGGRITSGLVNPAGVVRGGAKVAARGATALQDIAEAGSLAATRKITGNPNLTYPQMVQALSETGAPVSSIIKNKGGNFLGQEDFVQGLRQEKNKTELADLWDLQANEQQRGERFQLEMKLQNETTPLYKLRQRVYDLQRGDVNPKKQYIGIIKNDNPHIEGKDRIIDAARSYEIGELQNQIRDIMNRSWQQSSDIISAKYGLPTLEQLDQPRQVYNQWVEKPLTKYITTSYGTAEDPLRRLADEGIDKWINNAMLNEPPNKEIGRFRQEQGFPAEGVGKTPLSRLYEEQADEYLKHGIVTPEQIKQANNEFNNLYSKNPWIDKLEAKTPLYALNEFPPEFAERLGKEVKTLVQEGKIKPDQVAKWTPESIARSAHERAIRDEKAMAGDKKAMDDWAKDRQQTIPKAMEWSDGDSIAVISKDSGTPEEIQRDLSLQTCMLNHCVGSAGHDAGKYIPMVLPHTGKPHPKAKPGHGTGYYEDVINGDKEIQFLQDKNGQPKLTMDIDIAASDERILRQLVGEENGPIPKEYKQKTVDYLNDNYISVEYDDSHIIGDLNQSGIMTTGVSSEIEVVDQIQQVLQPSQWKKLEKRFNDLGGDDANEVAQKLLDYSDDHQVYYFTDETLWDVLKQIYPEIK